MYVLGNPVGGVDPSGELADAIFAGAWGTGGTAAAIDGPLPIGDVVGIIIGLGGTAIAGGVWICEKINADADEKNKEAVGTAEKTKTDETNDTVIYRSGNSNATNLTPRQKDVNGLSYYLHVPKSGTYTVTSINAVNGTGVLKAVIDGENHVSVIPTDSSKMQEWIDSRPNALTAPHEYTKKLMSISFKLKFKL